jgi:hypothetical protein
MRWILPGGLGLAVVLLIVRFFFKSSRIRLTLAVVPGLIFAGLALFVAAMVHPRLFPPLVPYESVGTYKTTDTEGAPWDVDVSCKYLSNSIPPGVLPRVKLVARSAKGQAEFIHDTGWRFEVSGARPVPGGIEVFTGHAGLRFELKGGDWSVSRRRILRSTSLWEDRLQGQFKVGILRNTLLELVRTHRTEDLPDLRVWVEGDWMTQHSLDREAAIYAMYSADGKAERVELRPRMRGTIEELREDINPDLFPLVALIQGAPELLEADPVGLIRAVNGLRAAGRDRATAALREYHRIFDPNGRKQRYIDDRKFDLHDDRLFCILRLLFVPKVEGEAIPLVDMPWVRKPPTGETGCPLYPVILEQDFPFMIWTRQLGGGSPQDPMIHLHWCLENARLRDADLEPKGSPIKSMDAVSSSKLWERLFPDGDHEQIYFLRSQVIAALQSVLPYPEGKRRDEHWYQWLEEVTKLDPRWDPARKQFVRGKP